MTTCLDALLEIAAVAGAGQERPHVELKDRAVGQHVRHFIMNDLARQAFRDGGLADTGLADEQGVVLLAAAQHLNGAVDFRITADQRIDLAVLGFLVEVDAIGFERVIGVLALAFALVGRRLVVDAARGPGLGQARAFGNAMGNVVDRVVAGHFLLLQEEGRVALTLGEDGNQHIGAGHLLTAGRLHMDNGALDDALETRSRLRLIAIVDNQAGQFGVDVVLKVPAQQGQIDIAGAHDGRRIAVIYQGQQQMLERGVFVLPLVRDGESPVKGIFETARECWHCESLLLFHGALQRVLMLARKVHHLGYLGLSHLECKDATYTNAFLVDVQHNLCRLVPALVEKPLQHMDDELHGRVVVVQQQDLVEIRLLGLCARARHYADIAVVPAGVIVLRCCRWKKLAKRVSHRAQSPPPAISGHLRSDI